MAERRTDLFRRLTSLFRGGPTVKRKVKSFRSPSASTAVEVFKKSYSQVYSNALNAYGQYDRMSRYADFSEMEYCLHGDTKIAVPDGYKTIKELADEYGLDKEFIVYAYDHEKGKIVPAVGRQARQTRFDHAWKVTFDSGMEIIGTGNHRLMKRDATFCRIDELKAGDSMMPFYRRAWYGEGKGTDSGDGYRFVYTIGDGWKREHQIVAEWVASRELNKGEVVHHKNFVKYDNHPENLQIMTNEDHSRLHSQIYNGQKWSKENSEWIEKFKKQHSAWMKENNPAERTDITFGKILETCESVGFNLYRICEAFDTDLNVIKRKLRKHGFQNFETFAKAYSPGWKNDGWDNSCEKNSRFDSSLTFQKICNAYERGMSMKELCKALGTTYAKVKKRLNWNGFDTFAEFSQDYSNHKVVSVEYYGEIPLYDLTVDGYKNFATDTVISHNTPEVCSALDIYAEESTSSDEKGQVMHIYSENPKIYEILHELFHNTLNVEHNLTLWTRHLPVRGDSIIPLLDGRNVTIKQLRDEFEQGKENWVYSIQEKTQEIVPGKINWCGLTRKNSPLIRTWLDDGSYVDTTPDHEFLMRNGSRKKAEDLEPADSLMPFYRKNSSRANGDSLEGYEKVYNPRTDNYIYTHRRVAEMIDDPVISEGNNHLVTHHIDFDKKNNSPLNLRRMGDQDHIKLHANHCVNILHTPDVTARRMRGIDKWLRSSEHRYLARKQLKALQEKGLMKLSWNDYNKSDQARLDNAKRSRSLSARWKDQEFKEKTIRSLRTYLDNDCLTYIKLAIEKHGHKSLSGLCRFLKEDQKFISLLELANSDKGRWHPSRCLNSPQNFGNLIARFTKKDASEFLFGRKKRKNHRVDRTEVLEETDDVFCMEVLGSNGEKDRHNFMMLGVKSSNEVASYDSGVCVSNCKYGDFFLFNDVHPEMGVINAFPIPVNEVEREEGWDPNNPLAVRFRWVTQGNQVLEAWQVSHFRLMGNDAFLPYGSSILESARRIWRQLILIEDAMLVYRVVRSPERRVFYIDVGTVPAEDIANYMEAAQSKLKRSQVIDKSTGRVDLRYNPLPIAEYMKIPLLDGREVMIKDLAKEYESGKENWVYSINDRTNEPVPGKIIWCGKNYTAFRIYRVHMDDGTWVDTAEEHPYIMRDGSSKRADELLVGDSLMPFYRHLSSKDDGDYIDGYEKVYDASSDSYRYTHNWAAKDQYTDKGIIKERRAADEKKLLKKVIHHIDCDKRNNRPDNLQEMDHHCGLTFNIPKLLDEKAVRWAEHEHKELEKELKNHKVSKIEIIDADCDVYCMTVVGPDGEQDRHNFAVVNEGQKFISYNSRERKNTLSTGNYLKNSVDEDYFIPVRGGDTGTKIDTLAGGQHVSDIADVEYIQKKLFAALKVPKAYLGYDEMLSSKATLAQEDIRFSRTISRVQRVLIAELNKIAIIHLFAHGYEGDDLTDFTIHLSNPSTVAQQQKLELYRTKFEIAGSVPERIVDRDWIRKELFGFTDVVIEQIEEGLLRDKRLDIKIDAEGTSSDSDFGGGGGGGGGLGGFGGGGFNAGDDNDFDLGDDSGGGGGANAPGGDDEGGDDDTVAPKADPSDDLFASEDDEGAELITDEEPANDDGISLRSSLVDDDDDDDHLRRILNVKKGKKGSPPAKQSAQTTRWKHNRRRKRTHGASKTHMPNFKDIVSYDANPDDSRFFKGDIFGRLDASTLRGSLMENDLNERIVKPKLSLDMTTMLSSLGRRIGIRRKSFMLSETSNQDESIDVDVVDDEDDFTEF